MGKSYFFEFIQKVQMNLLGKLFRKGLILYKLGQKINQGILPTERIFPSPSNISLNNFSPLISKETFIAPNTTIIGDVQINKKCNIFYSNLIQSENLSKIIIGDNSSIQNLTIIKATFAKEVKIGENVYIGSNCYLENCEIADDAIISNGSKIGKNVYIGKGALVGVGSNVLEGVNIKEGEIWVGNPAKYLRNVSIEDKEFKNELEYNFNKVVNALCEEYKKNGVQIMMEEQECEMDQYFDDEQEDELKEISDRMEPSDSYEETQMLLKREILEKEDIVEDLVEQLKPKLKEVQTSRMEKMPKQFQMLKKNYNVENRLKDLAESEKTELPDLELYEDKKEEDSRKKDNWLRKF